MNMNNAESMKILRDCYNELNDIKNNFDFDDSDKAVGYINKYAIIRATGSIEFAFKKIIADKVEHGCHEQIKFHKTQNQRIRAQSEIRQLKVFLMILTLSGKKIQ